MGSIEALSTSSKKEFTNFFTATLKLANENRIRLTWLLKSMLDKQRGVQSTYKKTAFRIRKPIRSFRDLEVYQRSAEYATEIMTKVIPLLGEGNSPVREKLINCCLRIPESIASAHSRRFETADELKLLDNVLEDCNKAVVYLEQVRDIFIKEIEDRAICDDLIKHYILIRRKVFNLYKAWRKFQEVRR